ncbi:carbon-nitrogen hydrolase family protein [Hyphomonas adhaerens]|uniref:carbon-nitrogen hydrolase family protein n=1 Tax=Hyphomonas adhaerens TaxID=81029 RepID=UPI0009FF0976|nr:carbon-nitrogen hydrolase family protein [Hyphomonas adhaerens]
MSRLGVAAIQTAGEATGNLELIEQEVRSAARRFPWLSMIALGELAIHGASPEKAERAGGATEQRLQSLAAETSLWIIPGSLYEDRDGQVFNTTPIIDPTGQIIARYDKMFPFLPYEKGVASGNSYVVFDVPGAGKVAVAICYDIWFPELVRTLAAMGAEVIIVPTMTNTIDRDVELAIARANAAISQCFVVDLNVAGQQGNGRSVIYGPGGDLIYEAGAGREIMALELDLEQVRSARSRGWNGLGQVMKSFRDMPGRFPLHESVDARSEAMRDWGALEMPTRSIVPESAKLSQPSKTPRLTTTNNKGSV